jgi:dihydropteroate synthase
LLDVLADHKPGYVLMHGGDKGGAPDVEDVAEASGDPAAIVDRVLRFFEGGLARLTAAGLPESHVVLDPGIGFGKTSRESVALLRAVPRLQQLGRPLYVGLSMKSLFGDRLGLSLEERGEATRVATALLAERGVRYHRVHDAAAAARALGILEWFASFPPRRPDEIV